MERGAHRGSGRSRGPGISSISRGGFNSSRRRGSGDIGPGGGVGRISSGFRGGYRGTSFRGRSSMSMSSRDGGGMVSTRGRGGGYSASEHLRGRGRGGGDRSTGGGWRVERRTSSLKRDPPTDSSSPGKRSRFSSGSNGYQRQYPRYEQVSFEDRGPPRMDYDYGDQGGNDDYGRDYRGYDDYGEYYEGPVDYQREVRNYDDDRRDLRYTRRSPYSEPPARRMYEQDGYGASRGDYYGAQGPMEDNYHERKGYYRNNSPRGHMPYEYGGNSGFGQRKEYYGQYRSRF